MIITVMKGGDFFPPNTIMLSSDLYESLNKTAEQQEDEQNKRSADLKHTWERILGNFGVSDD